MSDLLGRALGIVALAVFAAALLLGPLLTPRGSVRPAYRGPRALPPAPRPKPKKRRTIRDELGAWVPAAHPQVPALIYADLGGMPA